MDETRTSFTCQQEHLLTTQQFMDELEKTIGELKLPLSLKIQEVQWVDGERVITSQNRIVVQNTVNSDIKLLAGIDVYGLVTIVERKTVLDPPIKTPERLTVPENLPTFLGCGVMALSLLFAFSGSEVGGVLGFLLLFGGLIYAGYANYVNNGYNQQRADLDKNQLAAVLEWIEKIVRIAEKIKIDSTSANLSTTLDLALRSTTKRVYEDRGAIKTDEERRQQTAAEMRAVAEQRASSLK
jgi:hypothetical protein